MADVHYRGFVPQRPAVPMVRSMSFHGLPTGHGVWHTPASPLDIPGASLTRRSRRLPYLLSVSVPDNADAVLSRSLLEQCRLDSISDHSPRSSSLKQYGSWASKVFSEVASSNKASLSTCASSNVLEEATEASPGSIEGTDTTFTKEKYPERRPELQASALSEALRGPRTKQEGSQLPNQIERVQTPKGDIQDGDQRQVKTLSSTHDDCQTARSPSKPETTGEKLVLPILIPSNQRSSPPYSNTGSSTSDTETWSDWSKSSPPGFISQSDQRAALLDRLMEYCYVILANNYTESKGDTSTSCAPSSTSSSSQGAAPQDIQISGQSSQGRSKKRSSQKESDASGDSDDDEGEKGLGLKRVKMEENMGKRLACPFFKRNPQRYQEERSCVGPGWRTVHRLKEHLYRCHTLPIHCLRCHEIFASEEGLQTHSLSDTPCQRRQPGDESRTVLEGIGLAQERRLRSRKRTNKVEEDKWRDAYRICFPDDISMPSPYYDIPALSESITSASSSGLVQYEDFVRTELPRRVRLELDRRLEQEWIPIEERLRSQLSDMMRDIQLTLLEEFRLRGAKANTESLPASTPSTNQAGGTPQRRDVMFDYASVGKGKNGSSTTTSSGGKYALDPPFTHCSTTHSALDGYKAMEPSGSYRNLHTETPLFDSWDTSQSDNYLELRDGELQALNWASNDDALGCFVPDVEDWARSWGNRV
ncbi:hypothetical protein N0V93_009361 [Gnomoniopsis smithogilvyi]|uniref:C2H2-type domain-containing protein n=1 Tax=Gnomoniopsis smithogilvyi TaxID=1191159 RepID=A0A9W8YMN5_9PEZI|nr:hypothetical protein N0V93_009361 [Gnomoniopsis smithogilvyi]